MRKSFKELLAQNRPLLGGFIQLPSPEVVEIFGDCGYDFIIIDNEHTEISCSNTVSLVRACEAVDTCCMIRPADESATLIKKALDTGASSLMIPNINSAQMARDVVYNAKYSPLGMRGACPGVRANYYGKEGVEYYPRANRETAIMLQVEGKQGVEEFDQILEVEGVDAINLGPVDLSMALGVPGDVNHPLVISTMKEMVKKCKAKGVKVGTFCMDPVNARKWLDEGMDIIEYHIDTMLMRAAVSGAVEEFKKLLG